MPTITGKAIAILSQYSTLDKNGMPNGVDVPSYIAVKEDGDYSTWTEDGYTIIGEAEITLHVVSKEELVANKVSALRQEVKKTTAEATRKVTQLEGQINDLLAIGFSAPVRP
jgi:hypothetical protein